jgi:hypothetical protein
MTNPAVPFLLNSPVLVMDQDVIYCPEALSCECYDSAGAMHYRLIELPGVTADLMDRLIETQEYAEAHRAPMPTLEGWLTLPSPVDVPIDLWPIDLVPVAS